MAKGIRGIIIADEVIMNKIYLIRGKKVMLDKDLAQLYGVETKYLKRQVKRNWIRFPDDFMFELNQKEFKNWRSQFGTSNLNDKMGLRYAPYAFTEQGVSMLSSVLNSSIAIGVNIRIIRIFTRLREVLITHKDILLKLELLEKKITKQDKRNKRNEDDIIAIFGALKELLDTPQKPMPRIGFKRNNEE